MRGLRIWALIGRMSSAATVVEIIEMVTHVLGKGSQRLVGSLRGCMRRPVVTYLLKILVSRLGLTLVLL